jgi:anti-sigma28 factor (negative regulator of flagellin synthesis)
MSEIVRGGADARADAKRDGAPKIGRLFARLKALQEVRAARVVSLRAQIAVGAYRPAALKIADAILRYECWRAVK